MEPVSLAGLSVIVGGELVGADQAQAESIWIQNVAVHSNRISEASVFFALPGEKVNGVEFAAQAIANGAVVAVVPHEHSISSDVQLIAVDDPLRALLRLAAWWRSKLAAKVIVVTGSSGKTVTKDAITHLISSVNRTYASPGSYNSQLGMALSILDCPVDAEFAVLEASATQPGEMELMSEVLRPDNVVVTNFTPRHRSNFPNRLEHFNEFIHAARSVASSNWVLAGGIDDDLHAKLENSIDAKLFVANGSAAIPKFSEPRVIGKSLSAQVVFPDNTSGDLIVPNPSREIFVDVEMAMTVAWLVGIPSQIILDEANQYIPTATRMEIWQLATESTLIRDIASTDPMAMQGGIRTARRLVGSNGRTILALGDPLERANEISALGLARSIELECPDAVYLLDSPAHQVIARELEGSTTTAVSVFRNMDQLGVALFDELTAGDVVLIHSSRNSTLADITSRMVEAISPTRLYCDLSAIESNVLTFRRLIGPEGRLMGMVKAHAYGTSNAYAVSCWHLQKVGVDALGVATTDEGVALRRSGVNLPVLVMLGSVEEITKMIRYRLTPLVYSPEMLEAVVEETQRSGQQIDIHLEVDSGMHRTGFSPSEAIKALELIASNDFLRLDGVMTHFSCADDPAKDNLTLHQIEVFDEVCAVVDQMGFKNVTRHAANTAAAIRFPRSHYDMVRVGLGLHGVNVSEATQKEAELVPALGLVSRIVATYEIAEGEHVGYGATFTAPKGGRRIGVIPAGYEDCIPRSLSNFGYVEVAGKRCPIVGIVSMDSMTIDITDNLDAQVGSDVLIYGHYEGSDISIEEVASTIGTIPYELMTRIGSRVQRIFTDH